MSVYSRWVEARGTISWVSTPAARQASKPVASSRRGSGPEEGDPGDGVKDDPLFEYQGWTVKPDSDWIASAGTTGRGRGTPIVAAPSSLSSATAASTRRSTPWT
jgi:hypothetical protein